MLRKSEPGFILYAPRALTCRCPSMYVLNGECVNGWVHLAGLRSCYPLYQGTLSLRRSWEETPNHDRFCAVGAAASLCLTSSHNSTTSLSNLGRRPLYSLWKLAYNSSINDNSHSHMEPPGLSPSVISLHSQSPCLESHGDLTYFLFQGLWSLPLFKQGAGFLCLPPGQFN